MSTIREQLYARRGDVLTRAQMTFEAPGNWDAAGHAALIREFDELSERIAEVDAAEQRNAASARLRVETGVTGVGHVRGGREAVYHPDGEHSFFRDLINGQQRGDISAQERLHRNNEIEARALGNTGGVGGSGGEFAPPAWLLEEFAALARPGRVTADRMTKFALPSGVSSINIPRVATGTTATIQSSQNTAASQTDMTTAALSSPIITIAGKQVIALQLLEQSGLGVGFDSIVLQDLAAAYAVSLDTEVISGVGTGGHLLGLLNVPGINAVTWTAATPAVVGAGGLYSTINKAIAAIATTRYLSPDTIIMHPRRWSWLASAFDGNNRPLVVPTGDGQNTIAVQSSTDAQGPVGHLAGLAVYTDPNLPVNLGVGTNQDPIIILRAADCYLWETPVMQESFSAPYADTLGVLVRCRGYASAIFSRYPQSVAVILGTGMVTPVYP